MVERLNLLPELVVCARHQEPFRPRWPKGYPEFATIAFDCLNNQEIFAEQAERMVEDEDRADITTLVAATTHLLTVKPICCWITPEELLEVYYHVDKQASVWERGRCSLCGCYRIGSKYRKLRPTVAQAKPNGGRTPFWPHVCLVCVAKGDGVGKA